MGEVRVLTAEDIPMIQGLLDLRPIPNIVVASRLQQFGIDRSKSGSDLVGYLENNRLISMLSNGFSLNPISATEEALDAFSVYLENRRCNSILGIRSEALGLWERLCARSFTQWASPREVRDHQYIMMIDHRANVSPDPRVEVIPTRYLDAYHQAALAMYTEEVGVLPGSPYGSYKDHVGSLMMQGNAYGVLRGNQVIFKADVVANTHDACQVGGVWLAPELRGMGLSEPLMAAVVAQCRERFRTVSLYVNHYNHAAVRCYDAIGFSRIGEFATVMY